MRKIKIDNKQVIARNATLLGFATRKVKANSYFLTTSGQICRSLGRIAECDSDGGNCVGYVLAMVFYPMGHCGERWINPDDISECYDQAPTKLAAMFFAPTLPYDAQTMRRLMEHGTLSEQFVDKHQERVAMFAERQANAI